MVIAISESTSNTSDLLSTVLELLMKNPRASIRQISLQLNLEYNFVRRLLNRLFSKGHLVPVLATPTVILGREAAVVRVKTSSHSDLEKLAQFSHTCNHVVTYMEINSGREAMIVITAENKQKVARLIELVRSLLNNILEISAEYGVLSRDALILLKNSCYKCDYSSICGNNSNCALTNDRNYARVRSSLSRVRP